MKIENYISQLLYRYQCVTVPGFGAFLTESQSAQLQENTHSFYPPKKLISFNGYLKNNDGLLANHIAQTEKIAYESAVSTIEKDVVVWKKTIKESGSMVLKNIGELRLNSENNVLFIPSEQVNYLTSSFGLSTFVSPSVKREVYKKEVELLEEKAPILFTPEKRKSFNLSKYAAIFIVGAGMVFAGSYFGNQYYQNKIQEETLAVQTKVQQKVNQKIQEATFFISNPLPTVTLNVADGKMPYHIVAGVFSKEKNADKIYDELLKLGYQPRKMPQNSKGLYPVFYDSFTSYSEAQNEMQKIKKTHNPEAWLLIEEL